MENKLKKSEPKSLIFLEQAEKLLEKVSTIDEAKEIRDRAEALRVYSKQSKKGLGIQNQCAEIRIRAERRAGEILKLMLKEGRRHSGHGDQKSELAKQTPKLEDFGISRFESMEWQNIAFIPKAKFEQEIKEIKENKYELTSGDMADFGLSLKFVKDKKEEEVPKPIIELIKSMERRMRNMTEDFKILNKNILSFILKSQPNYGGFLAGLDGWLEQAEKELFLKTFVNLMDEMEFFRTGKKPVHGDIVEGEVIDSEVEEMASPEKQLSENSK